jgi:ATP synthase protein I
MAQRPPVPTHSETPSSRGDAWHAFGALVAGVLVYGLIGRALDGWLGTSFLVVVGILTGASLGIFMTWKRFIAPQ